MSQKAASQRRPSWAVLDDEPAPKSTKSGYIIASATAATFLALGASFAIAADAHHSTPHHATQPRHVSQTHTTKGNTIKADKWIYAKHPEMRQTLAYNCVPTSVSMSLATLGVHATPDELAPRMHMVPGTGVTGRDLVDVYNQVQPRGKELIFKEVTSAQDVESGLSANLQSHVAVPQLIILSGLPWHGSKITGHAIVVDGLNLGTHQVRVFDPAQVNGGTHVLTTEQLLNALQMWSGVRHILVDQGTN